MLGREIRALEAGGIRTVVFAPGAEEQQALGDDMMSRDRLHEVIQRSFLAAGARPPGPRARRLLRLATG